MAKKNKQNKLQALIITLIAAILLSIFVAIPLMLVGYTWMMFALEEIPLWLAIVVSSLCSLAESLLLVSEMRD